MLLILFVYNQKWGWLKLKGCVAGGCVTCNVFYLNGEGSVINGHTKSIFTFCSSIFIITYNKKKVPEIHSGYQVVPTIDPYWWKGRSLDVKKKAEDQAFYLQSCAMLCKNPIETSTILYISCSETERKILSWDDFLTHFLLKKPVQICFSQSRSQFHLFYPV